MRNEVIDKISDLMIAALGLVAALAWNGAIQAIFVEVFGEATTIGPMLTYAIIVTVIAVIATIWVGRAAQRSQEKMAS